MPTTHTLGDDFLKLTGNTPFPWQEALYRQFLEGDIPKSCKLPTGLGKTSVLAVWFLALTHGAKVPRRLVYVVNRRTVVDQTTDEALKLKNNASLIAAKEPAVSTLRGQFADNREWCADPSHPAIICGTVDMVGSRLLFSGYGIGMKSRPLHAGFLGQDVLLVHDEAHLEPAFQTLLEAIKLEQDRNAEEKGKLHVMELTATSRGSGIPFELTSAEQDLPNPLPSYPKNDEDKKNTPPIHHVWWRLAAKKALKFHVEKRDLVPKTIGEMARNQWRDSQKAILIFVRTVGDVRKVVDALTEKKQGVLPEQVQLLTGTLRGLERDRLASDDEIFARFLPSPKVKGREGTVYLVCTSAGEVGVDISADHMICDLSSLDSMTQRFGRVNRRGEGDAQIDVVCESDPDPKKQENAFEQARWFTKEVLEQLPETNGRRNVSPRSLMDLKLKDDERKRAFAPEPTILPSTDILFDSWALTSIESRLPGRPDVGPYLHGLADDLPQTTIAWRVELDLLKDDPKPTSALKAIFSKHGIRPHETLTVPSYRVVQFLKEILKAKPELEQAYVVILNHGVKYLTAETLSENTRELFSEPTLVLPAYFGGLDEKGILAVPSKKSEKQPERLLDIADAPNYESDPAWPTRRRVLIKKIDDIWQVERLLGESQLPDEWDLSAESSTKLIRQLQRESGLKVRLVRTLALNSEGDAERALVCLSPAAMNVVAKEQSLQDHVSVVYIEADRLADQLLSSSPVLAWALRFAAKWHDEGKKSKRWQKYIGGKPGKELLGKSAEWCDPKILSGYRHEFGSLLRIPPTSTDQLGEAFDLALHLIATHHGYARPHFCDPWDDEFPEAECKHLHTAVIRRFGRLQRKYGRWGLAYLESLLRAADIAASRKIGVEPELDTDDTEEGGEQ